MPTSAVSAARLFVRYVLYLARDRNISPAIALSLRTGNPVS